jgi:hypothetical protein
MKLNNLKIAINYLNPYSKYIHLFLKLHAIISRKRTGGTIHAIKKTCMSGHKGLFHYRKPFKNKTIQTLPPSPFAQKTSLGSN